MRAKSFGQGKRSLLDKLIMWVRVHKISRLVPDQARLLDLGCGYRGELLTRLGERIKEGVGIDLSVGTSERHRLIRGRVDTPLPLPDNSFDIVTALAIIEHVDEPATMLKEARRVTRKGGRMILTTPSLAGKLPLEIMAKLGLISRAEIADHKRYYTARSLADEMRRAGWRKVRVKHFGLMYMNLLAEGMR